MSQEPDSPQLRYRERERAKQAAAEAAQRAGTAKLGTELMVAFNRGKTDPSQMAVLGHETAKATRVTGGGYEFCVDRDGVTYVVLVFRDLE